MGEKFSAPDTACGKKRTQPLLYSRGSVKPKRNRNPEGAVKPGHLRNRDCKGVARIAARDDRDVLLWVEADDKGLRFVLFQTYAFGECFSGVRGSFAPGQDAPYRRVPDAKYGFGGTIRGVHILLGAIGVGFFPER